MAEESKIESIVAEQKTRRSAIKTAAQVAVTAPAVGLLLSASTKSAQAQVASYDTGAVPHDFFGPGGTSDTDDVYTDTDSGS